MHVAWCLNKAYKIICLNSTTKKQLIDIGVLWENFDKYEELQALPNFTYINNADYADYPDLYNQIDTFISASFLEGGPVPLLESMLANFFPVVSNTGFCTDIIKHGENGFLFDPNTNHDEVINLIRQADTIETNTRETVLQYSWENCSKKIDALFTESLNL